MLPVGWMRPQSEQKKGLLGSLEHFQHLWVVKQRTLVPIRRKFHMKIKLWCDLVSVFEATLFHASWYAPKIQLTSRQKQLGL